MSSSKLSLVPHRLSDLTSLEATELFQEEKEFSFSVVNTTAFSQDWNWSEYISQEEQGWGRDKLLSKALSRFFLSRKLGVKPSEVKFYQNENGKPFLRDHRLHFSISHSGPYWSLACSSDHEVGVDLEIWRSLERLENVVECFFTLEEQQNVVALSSQNEREATALKIWTMKEAIIKLTGSTLFRGLNELTVQLDPGFCPQQPTVRFVHGGISNELLLTIALKKVSSMVEDLPKRLTTPEEHFHTTPRERLGKVVVFENR